MHAAVLTAPQRKFIRVSREQRIRCCLSRFFIYILRNRSSASACKRQRALPAIINLFRPNERRSPRRDGSHGAQR